MKVNRTISLDTEIAYKLIKEDNYSELINSMLIRHYKDSDKSEEDIIKEVKDLIKEKKAKQIKYNKYNNSEYVAKRSKEMKEAKEMKNG